jgi:ABC-type Fe3+ transport system substrate-binding protein
MPTKLTKTEKSRDQLAFWHNLVNSFEPYKIVENKGLWITFYGIMWNIRYLKAKKIPVPQKWADLKKPVYFGTWGCPHHHARARLT